MRRADGLYRWMMRRRVPAYDEAGRLTKWYGIGYEIEDRKHAEDAITARERDLKLIIDTFPRSRGPQVPTAPPISSTNTTLIIWATRRSKHRAEVGGPRCIQTI